MSSPQRIQAPVARELAEFQGHFKSAMKTDVALLDRIMRYIIKRKGKQMRPLFVFLSAHTVAGGQKPLGERSHIAASLIELLHTATLVHDDVVDESPLRRGFFSIQALWKKKIAVLVGDYLLSRGLLMAVDKEAYDLLKITSEAVRAMSEGELLQLEKARRLDITEEVYFDIIQRKTASLIAACCACGAASVHEANEGPAEDIERMRRFGELVGLAFQIKDDLLDLGEGERIGKPTGGDIRERKMTLPLIHTLQTASPSERRRLIRLVKYRNNDNAAVQEVMDAIINGPGMDYARRKMRSLSEEALELLEAYPDSEAKSALIELVEYTMDRKR
jgi:octaprenyl-diphosphate synthase